MELRRCLHLLALLASSVPVASTVTWVTETALPSALRQHSAVFHNSKVFVIGGFITAAVDTVYSTTDASTWENETTLPAARRGHAVASLGSKVCASLFVDHVH